MPGSPCRSFVALCLPIWRWLRSLCVVVGLGCRDELFGCLTILTHPHLLQHGRTPLR